MVFAGERETKIEEKKQYKHERKHKKEQGRVEEGGKKNHPSSFNSRKSNKRRPHQGRRGLYLESGESFSLYKERSGLILHILC